MCEAQTTSTVIVTKGEDAISNTRKSLDAVCLHVVMKKLTLEYLYMPGMQRQMVTSPLSLRLIEIIKFTHTHNYVY